VMASMYAVYHGPAGLAAIAGRLARYAGVLASALRGGGLEVEHETFFDTLLVRMPAAAEVVRGELDPHAVARIHPNAVTAHLPGGVAKRFVPVVELNAEHAVTERFDDLTGHLDLFFLLLRHCAPSSRRKNDFAMSGG